MTPKIKKQQLLQNAPQCCNVRRLLDDESLAQKYLTLSLKFLAGQINQTIFLGRREYTFSYIKHTSSPHIYLSLRLTQPTHNHMLHDALFVALQQAVSLTI